MTNKVSREKTIDELLRDAKILLLKWEKYNSYDYPIVQEPKEPEPFSNIDFDEIFSNTTPAADAPYVGKYTNPDEYVRAEQRKKTKTRVSGAVFYITLITILVVVYLFAGGAGAGAPGHLGGFSAARVLTASMQSELPQDSLIITRRVDPAEIQVGDDITFLINETTTVTHRVVVIFENYAETGQRGFQTQGIENAQPDREIVLADNIVGRVVFNNLFLGRAARLISENLILALICTALLIGFLVMMKIVILPGKKAEQDPFPNVAAAGVTLPYSSAAAPHL